MACLVAIVIYFYCLDRSRLTLVIYLFIKHVSTDRETVQIFEIWQTSHQHIDLHLLLQVDVEAFQHWHCGQACDERGKVVKENVL